MAPSVFLLCILFSVGFLIEYSICISELELGLGFKKEPQDVIGVKGKSLVLPCEPWTSRSDARLEIAWFHNDEFLDLDNDTRRQILSNGSLYFTKLVYKKTGHGQSDHGEYRCVVFSQYGSLTSRTATLKISAIHAFTENPSSETVEEGSNVRLFCSIESTPEASIIWEKGNLPLPQNNNKYAQVSGPGIQGSVLYIFNVSSNDTGRYRCSATNAFVKKPRRSSIGLITVKPRQMQPNQPSFTFLSSASPNLRTVKEGDDVMLDCVVTSFPMPTLIWSFVQNDEGKPKNIFNENQKLYSVKSGYNILAIKNVTKNQSGSYTCSAMNVSQSQTMTTNLNVQTAPQFLEMPESKMFHAAKTIRFHCKVEGNPVPDILWMKDGVRIQRNGRIKLKTSVNETRNFRSSELLLSSTVSNDSGIYQCVSNNSLGNIWAGSRLFLNASKPPPSAPEKVTCHPLSSTQMDISWDVPDSVPKKDIKAFSIHYWTDGGEERLHPTGPDNRSSIVDKLLPFTNYTFSIRLYIDAASEFSERVICQTGEEVPIAAPDIMLESTSPNSIRVSWIPLSSRKARGIVTEYKVQWRIANSPSTKVVELTSDVLDYTITGLTPGKNYDIRVLAATSKGWPHLNLPWTTFEIPQKYSQNIPSAPNVTLLALNSSAIKITWNVSSSENELQGYKIFYRKQNSNQIGPLSVPANITEYLITELEPETSYEIMVLGYTNNSEGETGTSSIHTLPEDTTSETTPHELVFVPEPPVGLEADPVSPVAINLTWIPPKLPLGASRISYYTVCFNEVQTSLSVNASSINCLQSSKNQISVTNLKPYTLYEFKVRSNDVKDRYSVYSQTLECLTLEDVPSEVLDVNWKALNKTTVRVTWKEPLIKNGLITNFTVSYTDDFSLPVSLWAVKVVPGNKYSAELTNLQANVRYYVIVRASTKAGFGLHKAPVQVIIPDKRAIMKTESPKSSKDKHSDQYVGIIVGLAIGLSCIIVCTLCIVCRRRCTKRQVPQDGGQTPGRHANGNGCQRSRENIPESHEMEYFTYLSSQSGRNEPIDITPQHLDTKGHYPNGFINGVRLSLVGDNRYPNGSFTRGSINITENPRYDPNSTDSPLLGLQSLSCSYVESETTQNLSSNSGRLQDSNVPLLTGKRKFSDAEKSCSLSYEDSESESEDSKKKPIKHPDKVQGFSLKNQGNEILQNNVEILKNNNKFLFGENYCNPRLNENGRCLNKNHVLENPEFRFSDSCDSGKNQIKKNGYLLANGYSFCNGTHERGDNSTFGNEDVTRPRITDIFKNTQSITNSVNDK